MNEAGRFRVAMGVFDTVSILVGIGVILLLVAMLVSLVGWLRSGHSAFRAAFAKRPAITACGGEAVMRISWEAAQPQY